MLPSRKDFKTMVKSRNKKARAGVIKTTPKMWTSADMRVYRAVIYHYKNEQNELSTILRGMS